MRRPTRVGRARPPDRHEHPHRALGPRGAYLRARSAASPIPVPFSFRSASGLPRRAIQHRAFLRAVSSLSRLESQRTVDYVILNDAPQRILVAQCDGEDAETLAYGVLLSILHVGQEDGATYGTIGLEPPPDAKDLRAIWLKRDGPDWPFALGSLDRHVSPDPDTSNWPVNLDWGDNGLLGDFLESTPRGAILAAKR